MDIQFELATQNHPPGSGLVEGQPAVTFGYNFGSGQNLDANWAGYFNIIIRSLSGGILGFSPLGPQLSGYGVTIDNNYFSSGTGCSGTGSGRTSAHDLPANLGECVISCARRRIGVLAFDLLHAQLDVGLLFLVRRSSHPTWHQRSTAANRLY